MKKFILLLSCFFQQHLFSQPKINSFTPLSGPTGTLVTINGTGFSAIATNNIVFFGSVRAAIITASPEVLTVTVPAFASYQPITVTTGGLTAYAKDKFTVTFICGTFTANTFPDRKDTSSFVNNQTMLDIKDLDNDGKPELITSAISEISVYKNNSSAGHFSLSAPINIPHTIYPYFVTTADIDGDGKPDIVVSDYLNAGYDTSHICIYKNATTSAGIAFEPPVIFKTNGGYGIATADLDGDGKPDVMSTDDDRGLVSVHRNTTVGGSLSFARGVDYVAGYNARQVTTGFLDGDDKPEMIVTNQYATSFSVYVNKCTPGNILFDSKIDFETTPGGNPEAVFAVDFDGDDKTDVVVVNNNYNSMSTISVFRNITEGGAIAFAPRLDLTTGLNWYSYYLAIGDIDGDGKVDIISNNQTNNSISMFRNTSVSGTISFEAGVGLPTYGSLRRPICLSDLDGDGRPDIAEVTSDNNTISTFLNVPGKPTILSFTPTEACEGTKVTITGTSLTGTTAVSFGGIAAASFNVLSSTTIIATPGIGASGIVSITTPCGTATLGGFIFNQATAAASVTINTSTLPVCAGTEISFNAVPVNGGATPVYQWQVNGIVAVANAAGFTSSTLKNGDSIKLSMSSALTCVSGSPATAVYIVKNILPASVATINISASALTICPATSVTFTATTNNEGTLPLYRWQVNGIDAPANTPGFTTSSLVDGDVVTCVLTSNYQCLAKTSVTSNSVRISVASVMAPSIIIKADANDICKGTLVTFKATAVNGGTAPVYQWKLNGRVVGTDNTTYSNSTLADADVVVCKLTNAGSCNATTEAVSNQVLMHIKSITVPSVTITVSANNICKGTMVTFTASAKDVVSAVTFQWKLNGVSVGGNNTIYQTNGLDNGDKVYCEMNAISPCMVTPFINSDTFSMLIKPVPEIFFDPAGQAITLGATVQLNATVTGNYNSYIWTPATGLNNANILNPIAGPIITTTYKLSVAANDCATDKSLTITVLKDILIPSSFTPNGDGNNDVFRIPPGTSFKLTVFRVYDKYGNEIFKTTDLNKGWDGTYKGVPLESAAYVYMINGVGIKGKVILKGSIVLLR